MPDFPLQTNAHVRNSRANSIWQKSSGHCSELCMELQTAPDLPLELVDILLTNLCDEDVLICMLISKNFLKVGLQVSFERPIPILFRYCKQALQKIKSDLDGRITARMIDFVLIILTSRSYFYWIDPPWQRYSTDWASAGL
jgi:hypothetical protein